MSETTTFQKPGVFLAGSKLGRPVTIGTVLLFLGYATVPFAIANLLFDDVAGWQATGVRAATAGLDGTAVMLFVVFGVPLAFWGGFWRPVLALFGLPAVARLIALHSVRAMLGMVTGHGAIAFESIGWQSPNDALYQVLMAGLIGGRGLVGSWLAARRRPWVPVACPIGGGWVGVAQGGGRAINHHWRDRGQRYAVDLIRIRRFTPRVRRPLPRRLDDFLSYRAPVLSPVSGRVISVTDGVDELGPIEPLFGNAIVLEPDGHPGYRLVLAHVRPGSLLVARHDRVRTGQPLAEVGTSGMSTEPHLHMHVTDPTGVGVPMVFVGRRRPPRRNDVLRAAPDQQQAARAALPAIVQGTSQPALHRDPTSTDSEASG
jgi:hypothetical protein